MTVDPAAKETLRRHIRALGPEALLREGAHHFNAGRFFEAHEVWEALWHRKEGSEKEFVQGLVQIAVAYAHARNGNRIGFRSVMEGGLRRAGTRRRYHGLDVAGLILSGQRGLEGPFPPAFPKLRISGRPRSPAGRDSYSADRREKGQ